MERKLGVGLLMTGVVLFCLAGASEAVNFRYEDLGTLGGHQSYAFFDGKQAGINSAGQVTGMSYTAGGALHAFVKSPWQSMVDLGILISGSSYSYAPDLNNSGVVSGWYNDSNGHPHACKWVPQADGSYLNVDLGGSGSLARGINDSGYVAGGTATTGQIWSPGGDPQALGVIPGQAGCTATAISNTNQVVGYAWDAGGVFTACSWSPSGDSFSAPTSLFGVPDSRAFAINNSGWAVGYVRQSYVFHAALKVPGVEGWQDLGNLYPGFNALAHDINDAGQVVGEADSLVGIDIFTNAFLWTSATGLQNLNNLVVDLPAGVRLVSAMAINQRGEIAGYMQTSGSSANGVFKLTPMIETTPALPLLLLN